MATPTGHLLGYARVSTAEQNADLQTDELTAAGCWRIWTDHASGSLERRPALDEVLGALRPGDTLVIWRLDRLGRSLRHLIEVVTDLDARGVGFRSLGESIDTTTPGGRLVFHLFGALAQFEREIIRDRTIAGLEAARARGRKGGRPAKLTPAQQAMAKRLYAERRHTVAEIGALLGVSRTSIYRLLGRDGGNAAVTAPPGADAASAAPPATAPRGSDRPARSRGKATS
jgi:DNA invertase Pin-like site-specific DNA recombinase